VISLSLFRKKKKEHKKGYVIHEMATKYLVCRILNEYPSKEQAQEDLVKLLTHEITEENLLTEFDKKESW
jgi:hypothetical protein